MSPPEDNDSPAVVVAFLRQILEDRERGAVGSVAKYQRRFAGYEDVIADEYRRLVADDSVVAAEVDAGSSDEQPALIRGPVAARYQDAEEIARGGMGTIYRVWDPALRRGIAKKVLGTGGGSARASTAGLVERFLEEAQVTAQLEHPGIVPVHELGLDADGRVYFTMSLVRGRDFKEIIERVHAGRDGWTRTRALGVLHRVCEAVAFAHSRGVIHRDLKPANVMVGQFGETYVLDWGLARVDGVGPASAAAGAAGPARAVQSGRRDAAGADPTSPALTHEGDVVGTPAYMAPEQARGDLEAVGPRSDVFSIGAMLYHLLSGRMPYADAGSTTWRAVLDATLSGPPTSLREVATDVPEELVAICDRATARDPGQRYASAQDLGEDVRAFLETRVVRAHRTGAIAELRKWVRRNRLAAAAAALAFVSLAAGLGTSLWLKGVADDSAERTRLAYEDTRAAKEAAELELELRQAVLEFLNKDLLAAVAPGAAGRDASMRDVLDRASKRIEGRFLDQPLVEAAVRATLADTYRRLGVLDEADRHASRAVELYAANADASASDTLYARRVLALILRRQNRLREAEQVNREILAISTSAFGPEHDDTMTAANNLGLVLTYLGEQEEAEAILRQVLEVRVRTLGEDHDHTLASMCNLGLLYYECGRYREAEPLIKRELDLCVGKHGEEDPGSLVSMNNYANLLAQMQRDDAALLAHERVIRISETVRGPNHPETVGSMISRGLILKNLERYDEAREQLRVARERGGGLEPDNRAHFNAEILDAEIRLRVGEDPGELLTDLEELLARCRRVLGVRAPQTLSAAALRAEVLAAVDRTEDAVDDLEQAIAAGGATDTDDLSRLRVLRGRLLTRLGRFDDAEAELLRAEGFFAANAPEDRGRGHAIEELVELYDRSGRPDRAQEWRAGNR